MNFISSILPLITLFMSIIIITKVDIIDANGGNIKINHNYDNYTRSLLSRTALPPTDVGGGDLDVNNNNNGGERGMGQIRFPSDRVANSENSHSHSKLDDTVDGTEEDNFYGSYELSGGLNKEISQNSDIGVDWKIAVLERNKRNSYNSTFDDNNATFDEITEKEYLNYIYPKNWTWALIFLHCVVFVVGLVGNCLVCVAVYRNHTMRTVTNYFIVNLAVADFLVILFCLPPTVVWDVTSTWWFGVAMCKIVLCLQSVSVTVSILTLTFISIDRWYAICYPLKFKSTTGRAKTAIGIIWIVALACEMPEVMYLTAVHHKDFPDKIYFIRCDPTWSTDTDTIFMISKMVIFYALPLVFMSVAYIQIIKVLWKSGNAPHHQMSDLTVNSNRPGGQVANTFAMNMNASTEGQLRSRRKAAKMLVCVVIMFAFCFLPVHLLAVLRLIVKLSNSEVNQALSLVSHWLCYANSAVNPIIYNFMSGKFRKEFRRAFDSCCQRNRSDYHQSGTFYNRHDRDSRLTRSHSRTDYEIHRLNTYKDSDSVQLTRKSTLTSTIKINI